MTITKYFFTALLPLLCISFCQAQILTADEVLDKAIAFHDPEGQWDSFNDTLQVTMTTPKNADRHSSVVINLPKEYFRVTATRGYHYH